MILENVKIFRLDKSFQNGFIELQNGLIKRLAFENENPAYKMELEQARENADEAIDGAGCYAIPGLIDIHFHGCMGYDFCDGSEEAIAEIAAYEASQGVTGIAPATMTLPVETLEDILSTAAAYRGGGSKKADLLGVNMEGPFISRIKKGAQDERYIIPLNAEIFARFQKAAKGLVKFIGIAPEEGGAEAFIESVKNEAAISLAHTNADYEAAKKAFDLGASHAVHLYNAMPPFTHRQPGVIGAVADSGHVMAELICDGVHIHPAVVRATLRMLGEERVIFISDSMRATGMPDGEYTLGGLAVNVKGNRAALKEGGALAGSVTNLLGCLRVAVQKMNIPLGAAVLCASANPAKSLGLFETHGSIDEGKKAHIVLLDESLSLKAVIKDGEKIV